MIGQWKAVWNLSKNSPVLEAKAAKYPFQFDNRFYTKYNVTCIDFVRSSPAPRQNCALGPRDQVIDIKIKIIMMILCEQVNQITSYLDGSNLYGSSAGEQHRLRLLSKGKLRYTDLHIRFCHNVSMSGWQRYHDDTLWFLRWCRLWRCW